MQALMKVLYIKVEEFGYDRRGESEQEREEGLRRRKDSRRLPAMNGSRMRPVMDEAGGNDISMEFLVMMH